MPSAQSLALRARNGTPGIQSLESLRRHPHRVWCAEAPASGSRTGGSLTRSPISPTPHQHDTDTDTDNGGHPPQEAPRYRYPHRDGTCSRWDKGPGIALLQQAGIQQKTKNCRPRPAAQGTHGTPKKKKKLCPNSSGPSTRGRLRLSRPTAACLPALHLRIPRAERKGGVVILRAGRSSRVRSHVRQVGVSLPSTAHQQLRQLVDTTQFRSAPIPRTS